MDVILVPGLGDHHNERMFVWLRPLWRLYGIRLHIYKINWEDGSDFEGKYNGLKQLAQSLDDLAGVVGASAGASAAVTLLAREPQLAGKVVTVCGLLEVSYLNSEAMSKRSPAFMQAMTAADAYLRADPQLAAHIMTIRPRRDGVVRPNVATTPGARDVRVNSVGHAVSIAYILTFKIGLMGRFLQND